MSLYDIFTKMTFKSGLSIGAISLVIILSLIQVSKIQLNPWDAILRWIGNRLNSDIKKKVDEVEKKLDKHILESETKDLRDTRQYILDFANSCMYGRRHTQEQYRFVIKKCDEYEKYVEENRIKNGEIASAILYIRKLYNRCMQNNSFLQEGDLLATGGDEK